MYTQCDHCKAIFEVSMREVTVSAGQLRCGECNEVFDAMASLSTTLPTPFSDAPDSSETDARDKQTNVDNKTHANEKDNVDPNSYRPEISKPTFKDIIKNTEENVDTKWLKLIALALASLLLAQILYNNRHFFSNQPVHAPEQIEMLNNNVFAHPNEEGVLLISASIENQAEHDQPYPILEVRLTDAEAKLVALRRFEPKEYLEKYNNKMLLEVNKPTNLKLKIIDPGNDATRFQFKFL